MRSFKEYRQQLHEAGASQSRRYKWSQLSGDIDRLFDQLKATIADMTTPRKDWMKKIQDWWWNQKFGMVNTPTPVQRESVSLQEYKDVSDCLREMTQTLKEAADDVMQINGIVDRFKERLKQIIRGYATMYPTSGGSSADVTPPSEPPAASSAAAAPPAKLPPSRHVSPSSSPASKGIIPDDLKLKDEPTGGEDAGPWNPDDVRASRHSHRVDEPEMPHHDEPPEGVAEPASDDIAEPEREVPGKEAPAPVPGKKEPTAAGGEDDEANKAFEDHLVKLGIAAGMIVMQGVDEDMALKIADEVFPDVVLPEDREKLIAQGKEYLRRKEEENTANTSMDKGHVTSSDAPAAHTEHPKEEPKDEEKEQLIRLTTGKYGRRKLRGILRKEAPELLIDPKTRRGRNITQRNGAEIVEKLLAKRKLHANLPPADKVEHYRALLRTHGRTIPLIREASRIDSLEDRVAFYKLRLAGR